MTNYSAIWVPAKTRESSSRRMMLHLLAACCAFHGPSALPRLAQQRSSTVRSAAFALPIEDARTKVLYDGKCMVRQRACHPASALATPLSCFLGCRC